MLRLNKKADYALISLGYLAERANQVLSAREIAENCRLPQQLLMNILKVLHQHGIVRSVRGASGGDQPPRRPNLPALLGVNNFVEGGGGGGGPGVKTVGPSRAAPPRQEPP